MPEASGSGVADESDYSIFENKTGLAEDMKFLASMPELCDVTFLVGETREPVCAVKAVLAARSRVFHKMLCQAPSPQRKKEPLTRENKIRLFLKRSSEPLLNLQNAAQQPQPNQHHTLIVEEFEADVFRQLIQYIHTGCVTLQPRTLLGVMNAADYYGLDELRRACAGFVQCCITVDTVCALLASAERYIQYKCTKSLLQKVLEFVDKHGNEVLNLGSFTLLPQHVVRLILAREELRAEEFTKFQAALMWSKKYCDSNQNSNLKEVISNFLECIQFYKIPTKVLMDEVKPLGLVPSEILINAVAYQADPTSVDPGKLSPLRVRRHDRSMSVQSSPDPFGSITTLSSSGSDAGSDQKQHSGKSSAGEQETPREHLRQLKKQREEEEQQRQNEIRQQQDGQEEQKQEGESMKEQDKSKKDESREQEPKKVEIELKESKTQKQEEEESKDQKKEMKDGQETETQQTEVKIESQEKLEQSQTPQKESGTQQQENQDQKQQQEEPQKEKTKKSSSQLKEQPKKSKDSKQKAENKVQTETQQAKRQPESQKQPKEFSQKKQETRKPGTENEQRRSRLQLHLDGLKKQLERDEQIQKRREEALQRAIQERRSEEELESQQPQQLQLCLEGRRPETEKKLEKEKRHVEPRAARKMEKVKIRVDDSEVRKQEQQRRRQEQQLRASVDTVSRFYIRLMVRQEGGANVVWLLKTHIF